MPDIFDDIGGPLNGDIFDQVAVDPTAPSAFDPAGIDYDQETADRYGFKPDISGHLPSRIPETGLLLKGEAHPTFHKTVEAEEKIGNMITRGDDGRLYSKPPGRDTSKDQISTEDRSAWESFTRLFGDTSGEQEAKYMQALIDAEAFGMNPADALQYQGTIDRGIKINPDAARLRASFGEKANQSWVEGSKQRDKGLLNSEYVMTGDTSWLDASMKIKMLGEEELFIPESRFEDHVMSAAKLTPISLNVAKEGGYGAGVAGVGVGTIAILAGQPELAFPLGIAAAKIGGGWASWKQSMKIESGLAVEEILTFEDEEGNKIDPDIARGVSMGYGVLAGALEVAELKILMDTIPGFDKIFKKAMMKTLASKTMKRKLLDLAGLYATVVGKEVAIEAVQESSNIGFEEFGKQLNNFLKGTDIKPTDVQTVMARLKETIDESVKGFSVIAAPGVVIKGGGVVMDEAAKKARRGQLKEAAVKNITDTLVVQGVEEEAAGNAAVKMVEDMDQYQAPVVEAEVAPEDEAAIDMILEGRRAR